jgi:uncharacterized protein (TIGR02271 family)
MTDTPFGKATNTMLETAPAATVANEFHQTVIPLFEERVEVSKQVVPTSRVQISRTTHSHEHLVDELLTRERVEIERIPVGKPVDAMPPIREEEDYIIIPVVEEVLKVERLLFLKEEVRIRRVNGTERYQERITLRKQEAVVNRLPVNTTTAVQALTNEVPKENL